MHLLDGNYPERMERGTPQRKTVYRISLTLVKKESLQGGSGGGPAAPRRLENPKVTAYRREGSSEIQRSCFLEEVKEVEDETDDFSPHAYRNFRTFSTGQLELSRLKVLRKTCRLQNSFDGTCDGMGLEDAQNRKDSTENGARETEAAILRGGESEDGSRADAELVDSVAVKEKRMLKTSRSAEGRVTGHVLADQAPEEGKDPQKRGKLQRDTCLASLLAKANGKTSKLACQTPPVKTHPSLLRRSFSFRHWTGSELLRIRGLSKEKHHSSSGCIGQEETQAKSQSGVVLQNPAFDECETAVKGEKRVPLDAGEVLGSRRERTKGKNRTLDNSDLLRLSDKSLAEKEGFLRGSGYGSSGQERRLIRFFSGIFSKKDATSTPVSSPNNRALRKNGQRRATMGHLESSTESVNGFLQDGNYLSVCPPAPRRAGCEGADTCWV